MPKQNLYAKKEEIKVKGYSPTKEEKKVYDQYLARKKELIQSRKNVQGQNIDELMRRFDKNYFNRTADIPASELDVDQKPIAINNAFGKVQAALSILIERNPDIILDERLAKYSANRDLIRSLAKTSWKNTNSLGQFKLSVFNAAKRGWFAGKTFNRQLIHDARFPISADSNGKITYETKQITKLDDIAYMNLDNHNVWFDEEARPEDMFSIRDAMHREVWHIDKVKSVFPENKFPNMKYVVSGGDTSERLEGNLSQTDSSITQPRELKKGMTELFFYENQFDDWFIVEINGVMVVWEPLPQSHKRLSYVCGYWNLRSAETIYGLGIIEEMERDESMIDRILNMNMRQLLLSINPPGFYTGTEDLENENIKLKAGVLRKTLNPKDITFLTVPPMKQEAQNMIQWLEQKEEQKTGITKLIEGEPSGKASDTAFEIGVNRESSLKRLKLPLQSLQYALGWEFQNRIDLIKQTYSDFQVEHLADEKDIMAYLEEVKADPDFYFIENEGILGQEKFYAKKYREMNLEVEQDDKGNFIESDKKNFFKIKPENLAWEGDVKVDVASMLIQSEELEKADTLRMANLLIPLFAQPVEIALKPAKQLLLAFNRDPKKWFPQAWLDVLDGKKEESPDMKSQEMGIQPEMMKKNEMTKPETVIPQTELENKPGLGARLGAAFNTIMGK